MWNHSLPPPPPTAGPQSLETAAVDHSSGDISDLLGDLFRAAHIKNKGLNMTW